uniref:Uncharacterized protein n=1 Tax=Oryza barthii TaxID=65489 RepID=A0A0D3HDL4_9ORYZ
MDQAGNAPMALESSKFLSSSRHQLWTISIPQGSLFMFPSIFLSGCMHSMLAMQNPMYVNVILMLQSKADEDKVLDIQTILVKYNIFHIDQ